MSSDQSYDLWEAAAQRADAMTAAGQEPRRQHLVPRFYIDRWAVNGRVRVVDLARERNAYETSPTQAAIETDFYRLEQDGTHVSPVFWEAWLSEVEGKASAAIARVDAEGMAGMDGEAHQWLCLFLAVQMTRSRSARFLRRAMFIEQMARVMEFGGPEQLARMLSDGGKESSSEDLDQLVADVARFRADPTQLPFPREEDLEMSASTAIHIAQILTTRHIALYRTNRAIITCDEPMVELHEDMARPALWGGIWGAPIFAFPFSANTCLALYRKDLDPPLRPGAALTSAETVDLNSAVLANAYNFAIARAGDRIAEGLYLPETPVRVRSARYNSEDGAESLFRFWAPRRWEGQQDAPKRVVARWWPDVVPPAPRPTAEEEAIMESWATNNTAPTPSD
ncbi:MAG: DUF4238 domain-containing protein [Homoserinimonas sp.]